MISRPPEPDTRVTLPFTGEDGQPLSGVVEHLGDDSFTVILDNGWAAEVRLEVLGWAGKKRKARRVA